MSPHIFHQCKFKKSPLACLLCHPWVMVLLPTRPYRFRSILCSKCISLPVLMVSYLVLALLLHRDKLLQNQRPSSKKYSQHQIPQRIIPSSDQQQVTAPSTDIRVLLETGRDKCPGKPKRKPRGPLTGDEGWIGEQLTQLVMVSKKVIHCSIERIGYSRWWRLALRADGHHNVTGSKLPRPRYMAHHSFDHQLMVLLAWPGLLVWWLGFFTIQGSTQVGSKEDKSTSSRWLLFSFCYHTWPILSSLLCLAPDEVESSLNLNTSIKSMKRSYSLWWLPSQLSLSLTHPHTHTQSEIPYFSEGV